MGSPNFPFVLLLQAFGDLFWRLFGFQRFTLFEAAFFSYYLHRYFGRDKLAENTEAQFHIISSNPILVMGRNATQQSQKRLKKPYFFVQRNVMACCFFILFFLVREKNYFFPGGTTVHIPRWSTAQMKILEWLNTVFFFEKKIVGFSFIPHNKKNKNSSTGHDLLHKTPFKVVLQHGHDSMTRRSKN